MSKKTAAPSRENMPYRRNAGVVLFNPAGQVFIGQRLDKPDVAHSWQFPQGGIDKGEEPIDAALRELYEEISVTSLSVLTAMEDWVRYDLPDAVLGKALKGKYRGQEQMWFAVLFEGSDSEINIATPGGGEHRAEFGDWRWEDLEKVPDLVVPFKRAAYEQVVDAFRDVPHKLAESEDL